MNRFTTSLLNWYAANKRELPWRDINDPYLIWISEIILQQTRVAQGFDYFVRFVHRFPDVASLAAASQDEVMTYWQGLGYYSRARNLHEAARSMNGSFPRTYEKVRRLKGVGEYTAAAICSFAYNMPYAVVDGNVYRVLARYFGIHTPIDTGEGKKQFAALAAEMMDKTQPATYNQAIMDFGALQCTPQLPDCTRCPLNESCAARYEKTIAQLPVKQHRTKTSNRYFNYLYVRDKEDTFIHKRTANDIWKNLFELPLIETPDKLSEEDFRKLPLLHSLASETELSTLRLVCRGVKHVLSHRIIYANFYTLMLTEGSSSFSSYQRVSIGALKNYAVSRLTEAFLEKYL
ncbi:MAG: A/G-specific adenine glycosylase [Prevotellaceae bacterium]|jgi:A/G-specific adenine glycosylase|nr:A/G-specific adenine glycosylase [Prevotellaceae bacterium]